MEESSFNYANNFDQEAREAELSPYDRYLIAFSRSSNTAISWDPESRGFTVSLMECHDLNETDKAKVPSLIKYSDPHAHQVSFYLYGLSEEREGKLTLLNDLPILNEIDFGGEQCLLVSFEENPEIYREILQKKAHNPLLKRAIVTSVLLTFIDTKRADLLSKWEKLYNDQVALLLAVSEALKKLEEYDIKWLTETVVISDMNAAIDFAISQRNLLLFDFLKKSRQSITLDANQKQKVSWLYRIHRLQQRVKKSFLPEPLARYVWYKKQSQQLRHEQKTFIKEKGSLLKDPIPHYSPIAAILKGTYYESNDIQKRESLTQKIADQLTAYSNYQKTPLMALLIHLLALNMVIGPGGPILTSKIRKYQPLKIIITTDHETTGLSPHILSDEHHAGGEYTVNKNNLFVAFDDLKDTQTVICNLLHEATHLAANEIYQNNTKPYSKWNVRRKKSYQLLKQSIINEVSRWVPNNQKESLIIERFCSLSLYKDKHIIQELFVKVPETIFILGYEQGLIWLNKHVPDLLGLYQEEFVPACLQYLKYRQINAHFSLDSFFSNALEKTSPANFSLVLSKDEAKMLALSFGLLIYGVILLILAAVNPVIFIPLGIAGLIGIAVALINPLITAINFHQSTGCRLVAMEHELPRDNNKLFEVAQEQNLQPPINPPMFSHPTPPQNHQADNTVTNRSTSIEANMKHAQIVVAFNHSQQGKRI